MLNKKISLFLMSLAIGICTTTAYAEVKIGFVNTERVMREAAPAVKAQKLLEKEFAKRDKELERMAEQLKNLQAELEKNAVTMSESGRGRKESDFNELSRDFQRRQREFREDLNQRRNEELARVIEHANREIKAIADAEKYDIIFQDAVYANPRIDITDKVLKALSSSSGATK